jgi:phage terminase large subunit GpA-like protein
MQLFHVPALRGFDEEFFLQLLSEQRETKLFRGVRTTVWKRIRARNEALDLTVMALVHLDMLRTRIDGMSEPQIVAENGEKPSIVRPAWGVQPGSDQLARQHLSQWGAQSSEIVRQGSREPREKRPWGAQPGSGNILDF